MNDRETYGGGRRGIAGLLLAILLAFVLGVALTAFAVRRWDRIAAWVHPLAVAAPIAPAPPRLIVQPVIQSPPPVDSALAARVDALAARLDGVDRRATAASGDADRAEGLLVAFAARRALDRGQPLGYIEGLLRARFGATEAPSVAMIIAAAQRPVTLVGLEDGLATLGQGIAAPGADEPWWTSVRRELGSLFVVRRADVPSAAPDARLARAHHALDDGAVDVAAAEVARMPGAARASGWLAAAHRYLLARAALDRIESAALLAPPATPAATD